MAHKTTHKVQLPLFEATPVDEIPRIAASLRNTFRTNKTKDIEYRLVQLRKLYWGLQDYTEHLLESLKQDLNKPAHDAHMTEVGWAIQDCMFVIQNLEKWAQDDTNVDIALSFAMLKPRIKKEPIGTVIIIGTYNFPVNLVVCPLIGAIAAGCPAVIKPSESAPATAMVLKELVEKYLDPTAYATVNGAVPETTALLNEKWDKIFYTGGERVAKIICKKAAETLTPVCLELGGRNPAFVSKHADLHLAARRLMWGKTLNAGQVCMSHNYVLVDRAVVDDFINQLNAINQEFFPNGAQASPDLARIVNHQHFDRMKKMLEGTRGKIVMGGETDRNDLFIAPTAVLVDSVNDIMIQEESFGPIWAILPYDNLDDAIKLVNGVDSTPLSLMAFGKKDENEKILHNITSGGASLNDSYMHGAVSTLPFGGVGTSGTGSYRGKASFDEFTHHRTVVETPTWMDKLLRVRYMPYQESDLKTFQWMNGVKPDFDRNGKKIQSAGYWPKMIFGLGGPSVKGSSE
ncbi:aldehyde dehydrogenase [Pseudomassariella vexata]|uniref:Aldehyde dehydrogenase n=1 Tax=Pseudomassariella vexata TaxID=1141098 RepID=A0A1Y2DUU4_9PEZI|nr:aldehyde dehydrogenase [Pseudomassariella vexata]ORY63052.1 aldehyde dehydrogenase [Pseudomassariella vexata]